MDLSANMVLLCSAFGVAAFLAPILGITNFRQGISTALDFWMAAGLIRLSGVPSWTSIATAALLILIRKLAGLRFPRSAPAHIGRA